MTDQLIDADDSLPAMPAAATPPPGEIGRHATRGGAIVLLSVGGSKLINLAIGAVLARLLTPVEFGLIGMVFTLTGFLQVFGDLGLSAAMVQKSDLDMEDASAAFWVTFIAGVVLWFCTIAASPVIASFYNERALISLTIWCGLIFPVEALGFLHIALMMRRFQFTRIAICELSGGVVGGIVAIVMAWRGYRASALVAQYVISGATISALAWILSRWVPSRPNPRRRAQFMMRFAGFLTASRLVNYFARNLDNVIVGRVAGSYGLGLYARAYALMMYPIALVSGPISRVALPALSQLQNDPARMRLAYIKILRVIGFITFPMMTLLFVSAGDLILFLYGGGWTQTVPIFRVLCIAGIYQGIYSAAGQILTASGRTDRMLWSATAMAAALSAGFFVGARWGPMGVAWAFVIVSTLALLPYLKYVYATLDQGIWPVMTALLPMLAASVLSGAGSMIVMQGVGHALGPFPRLMIAAICGAALYAGLLWLFVRNLLIEMWQGTIQRLLPSARNASTQS